ncbi:MAG: Zn-ribbon domain-containing OB-fold protein [Candidatus Bathyarchaeia archaeon]
MLKESMPFTIEQFYNFCNEGKFAAVKCKECNSLYIPPKQICSKCYSSNLEWVFLSGKGKLISFTIIHIAPPEFQGLAPYIIGIVKLNEGIKLLGIIKNIDVEKLKIGMDLEIDFEKNKSNEWPRWPRYYFKPTANISTS